MLVGWSLHVYGVDALLLHSLALPSGLILFEKQRLNIKHNNKSNFPQFSEDAKSANFELLKKMKTQAKICVECNFHLETEIEMVNNSLVIAEASAHLSGLHCRKTRYAHFIRKPLEANNK